MVEVSAGIWVIHVVQVLRVDDMLEMSVVRGVTGGVYVFDSGRKVWE